MKISQTKTPITQNKTNNSFYKAALKKEICQNSQKPAEINFKTAWALQSSALFKLSFNANKVSLKLAEIKDLKQIKIENFSVVEEGKCYRGGQPDAEGLRQLKKLGVKTIINLRDYAVDKLPKKEQEIFLTPDAYKKFPKEIGRLILKYKKTSRTWYIELLKEKCMAEKLGMKFVNIPMSTKVSPERKKLEKFLDEASNSSPIFIHCLYGRDRTGLASALYRIEKQAWPYDKAVQEMKAKNYKVLPGYVDLVESLADFLGKAKKRTNQA